MAPAPRSSSSSGKQESFAGGLATKNKADLVELAEALGLSLDESSKRTDLISSIQTHLDDHEESLRNQDRFKGLFTRRKHRASQATPDSDDVYEGVKATADDAADAVKKAGRKSVSSAKSTADDAVDATNKTMKSGIQRAKEMLGFDPKDIPLPDSPSAADVRRTLRTAANTAEDVASTALEAAQPIAEDAGRKLVQVKDQGLKMWRETGRREVGIAIRQGQEYLSNSRVLISTIIFMELLVLLVHLVPFNCHEIVFPPSQWSSWALLRFIHTLFSWVPEYKQKVYLPEVFAFFKLSNETLFGLISWVIFTVIPPFALSHLVSFMPQPRYNSSKKSKNAGAAPPLPTSDPLVFALTRLAILLFPLTNAAPDVWVNSMEKLGSLQGRALVGGLTAGYVLAERLAEIE